MEYTSSRGHRVLRILNCGNINKEENPVGYIYKNGDFKNYIKKVAEEKTFSNEDIGYIGTMSIIDTIETGDETYFLVYDGWDINGGSYYVCKDLPRVESGEIYKTYPFNWKPVRKYGNMEMRISQGLFEYVCVYNGNRTGFIDVKYTKCDNKHRNNVTIERIYLDDPTNIDYIYAIEEWKKMFRKEIKAA